MSKAKYNKSLHVLLTPELHQYLLKESKKSGKSIGSLIRESIQMLGLLKNPKFIEWSKKYMHELRWDQ